MGPQKAARRNEWHCRINDGLITMQGEGERDGDGVVDGLVLPSTLRVGEAMNKFVANSDEFCGLQAQNLPGSFSSFPQTSAMTFVNEAHGADRFMEGNPLPNASICMNQENIRYDGIGSSLETMLLHGYGGLLPLETMLRGKVVGRTRIPPPPPPLPLPPPPRSGSSFLSREWMSSNSQGSSQFSNELSLSLVPTRTPVLYESSIQEQCSEQLSSCSEHASCSSKRDLSWSRFEAQKPLQLPTLQSGSRFLQAMQEILAGIACYALMNFEDGVNFSAIGSSNRPESESNPAFMFQKQERSVEAKKKHLLTLLQMVDEQYSQCLDEIHTVTSAFHAVTELDPNLHARFALPTISLMYKNLRERISTHILAAGPHHVKEGQQTQENKSFEACFIQKQWALQQLSKRDHQLWRPQRGLPETSVSVLRTWMFQNFLHPYPKDSEKHLLALKSGLTRNQVSNWFINARVRLWKPMIEEMCAEMNRRKARREDEEIEGNHRNHMHLETRRRLTRD